MITRDDLEAQARKLEGAVHQSLGLIRSSMVKAAVGMVGKGAVKLVAKRRQSRKKAAKAEGRTE